MGAFDVDHLVARSSWDRRDPQFTALAVMPSDDAVCPMMRFRPADPGPEWPMVVGRWRELPAHPTVLRLASSEPGGYVWLPYAAISWSRDTYRDDFDPKLFATWGLQLASAFAAVMAATDPHGWDLLLRPYVCLDLRLHVRLGFLPPVDRARADERTWVSRVGTELEKLGTVTNGSEIRNFIDRCDMRRSLRRLKTLRDVQVACRMLGAKADLGEPSYADGWRLTEEALGWLAVRDPARALRRFEDAGEKGFSPLVNWGIHTCERDLAPREPEPPADSPRRPEASTVAGDRELSSILSSYGWRPKARARKDGWRSESASWPQVKPDIDRLETERAFKEAIALYATVAALPDEAAEVHARRARCHLELREAGHAIDYARRALHADPARVDAHLILVRALIESRNHAEALTEVDRLLSSATYDATAHYLRGKAFVGLGRLEDARDAFELALVLRPTMLEAMLLRREVDRMLVKLGKAIGTQQVSIAIPASLEHLRDVLTSGRSKPAIEALSAMPDDVDAQLMLARFLGFDGKHDQAIAIYERLAETSHRHAALVGKAGALLEQGHAESALALYDALIADTPNDREASEGRARALDRLGRTNEAAAEFRRFISLATSGANLRVRAAQLWLDHH